MDHDIDQVNRWLDGAGRKYFGTTNARLYRTAIGRFDSVRTEHDPKTAAWMLDNLSRLKDRFARGNPEVQAGSLKTYESRARTALQEYARWVAAPAEYSPKGGRRAADRPAERDESTQNPGENLAVTSSPATPPATPFQLEIQQALRAISGWPRLARYLLPGIVQAMNDESPRGPVDKA